MRVCVCVCSCATRTHLCFLSPRSCQRVEDRRGYMNKVRLFSLTPNEYVYSLQMSDSAAAGPRDRITKINQKPVLQFSERAGTNTDTDAYTRRPQMELAQACLYSYTSAGSHIRRLAYTYSALFCIFLFSSEGEDRWV